MDKVSLKLWTNKNELGEIFQSISVRMAHVNSNYEQVHQPGQCRDFLGDMNWSRVNESAMNIYGLEYDYSKNPYDTEVVRLSLKFPTQQHLDNFLNHLPYLREREEKAGVEPMKIYETEHKLTLVIEADKHWQDCTWKLSLLTFYFKIMSYEDMTKLKSPEDDYAAALTPEKEEKLLAHIKDGFTFVDKHLSTNHNSAGFYSVIKWRKADINNRKTNYGITYDNEIASIKVAIDIFYPETK